MSYFGLPEGVEYYIMNSDECRRRLYESAVVYIDNGFDIDIIIAGVYNAKEYNQMTELDKTQLISDIITYASEVQ